MLLKSRAFALRSSLLGTALLCSAWSGTAHAGPKECIASNNEAVELRSQHRLLAARERYLACAQTAGCPEVVRQECDTGLSEVVAAIPTLILAVVDDQKRDVSGASLTIDGAPVELNGSPLEVEPGAHQLVAVLGELRTEQQVIAAEGELGRRVEVVLAAPRPAPALVTAPTPLALPPKPRSLVPVYVLGGVAAVGAASFAFFAVSGHGDLGDLERCKPHCPEDDVQSVRTKYLVADISLGVSLAALGAATYLFLTRTPSAPRADAGVAFDWAASPDRALVGVRFTH